MKNITLATIKSIKRNGGATINKYGIRVSMKSGYQVSKQDLLIIPVDELNKFTLKELMRLLVRRGDYLGCGLMMARLIQIYPAEQPLSPEL